MQMRKVCKKKCLISLQQNRYLPPNSIFILLYLDSPIYLFVYISFLHVCVSHQLHS